MMPPRTTGLLLAGLLLAGLLLVAGGRGQDTAPKSAPAKPSAKPDDQSPPGKPAPEKPAAAKPLAGQPAAEPSMDELAIRQTARQFAEAFNRADAVALAQHWTEDGEYIDEEGERFVGREVIRREYEAFFRKNPGVQMRVTIDSIRLVGPDTALEDGRVAMGPLAVNRYSAVHVRQGGRWLMASVRDSKVEVPAQEGRLAGLEPLVGDWVGSANNRQLEVSFRWIADKSFLERRHTLHETGKMVASGVEIIGIDPRTRQLTSWSFVGGGGMAVNVWAPHEGGWMLTSEGALPEGTPTTAVSLLRRVDANTLGWQSQQRTVGETFLPDVPELLLKRKSP